MLPGLGHAWPVWRVEPKSNLPLPMPNGVKPPGESLFAKQTGISKYDWYPNFCLRWSDALVEAGHVANEFTKPLDNEFVIQRYIIGWTRDLVNRPGADPEK